MNTEICVPLASFAMEDEDAKTVSPAVGDPVDFQATGTVSRVEGDNAYITLESVNGDPLPEEAAPMPAMAGADPERDALMAQAVATDADEPLM